MPRVSQTELAKRLGVSVTAVRKAVLAGRLAPPGADRLHDAAEAAAQWAANTRSAMAPAASAPDSYATSRARREAARAAREELQLAKDRGELLSAAEAELAFSSLGAGVRAMLDVLPDQLAAMVAPESDPDACHQLLTDACRAALSRLVEAAQREKTRLIHSTIEGG